MSNHTIKTTRTPRRVALRQAAAAVVGAAGVGVVGAGLYVLGSQHQPGQIVDRVYVAASAPDVVSLPVEPPVDRPVALAAPEPFADSQPVASDGGPSGDDLVGRLDALRDAVLPQADTLGQVMFEDEAPALPPVDLTGLAAPAAPAATEAGVKFDDAYATGDIHVHDAPLSEVLRMLADQTRLNIVAHAGVTGTVSANLYDVTVDEALDAILRTNGFDYRTEGSFVHVYTRDELAQIRDGEMTPETRVFRVYNVTAADAKLFIEPILSADATVTVSAAEATGVTTQSGGSTDDGINYAGDGLLVVTDLPERLDLAALVLEEVDQKPAQILLEATILEASLTEDNQLGIDFNVLGGVDFNSVNLAAGNVVGGDVLPDATDVVSPDAISVGAGGGGLRLGVVTGDVSVFLNALEGVTDTTVLANPKVLALNKQEGRLLVGQQLAYIESVATDNLATQNTKFLDSGTKLAFRPFITGDGYIRLEVKPENSVAVRRSESLIDKFTTEVMSNVMVRDGHTVVIGGLFYESSATDRQQVPGLGNVPVVGPLFRDQSDRTERREIIILLTPHIVKDDDAYAELSEEQVERFDKLRVGVREGMMPWGRERLAESFYESALEELRRETPDVDKALFDLNNAINLNPKFLEAIELRQQLTGEKIRGVDNSTIHGFLRRSMLGDARHEMPERRPVTALRGTAPDPRREALAGDGDPEATADLPTD